MVAFFVHISLADAKVNKVALGNLLPLAQQNVMRLYVSMEDSFLMDALDDGNELLAKPQNGFEGEKLIFLDVIGEILSQ